MTRTYLSRASALLCPRRGLVLGLCVTAALLCLFTYGARHAQGGEPDAATLVPLPGRLAYISGGDLWILENAEAPRRLTDSGDISAVRWSTGGRWLFVMRSGKPAVLRSDGGNGPAPSGAWTPDDQSVAVATPAGGVDLVSVTGMAVSHLVQGFSGVHFNPVAWSPDGKTLALDRAVDDRRGLPGRWSVWIVQRDGTGLRTLAPATDTWPRALGWSPDGAHLAVWQGPPLLCASCRVDGQRLDVVTVADGELLTIGPMLKRDWFCWTPSGGAIVAAVGEGRETYRNKSVIQVTVATGETLSLSAWETASVQPACSPDGARLAFTSGPALSGPPFSNLNPLQAVSLSLLTGRRIVIADETTQRLLAEPPPGEAAEEPRWANERTLLYVRWKPESDGWAASLKLIAADVVSGKEVVITALDGPAPLEPYYGDPGLGALYDWHP